MAGAWRREAAWVTAERLKEGERFWPYQTAVEAEEARLEAQMDEETSAAFERLQTRTQAES